MSLSIAIAKQDKQPVENYAKPFDKVNVTLDTSYLDYIKWFQ